MGGGPPIGVFGAAVKRVDYRDGTRCPEPGVKRASCPPKGYVERSATRPGPSAGS